MKRIVMLTLLLLCGMTVFASPFGLEMGWTYDEIIDSGVKVIFGDTNFLCIEPINPHPTFDTYFLSIDDKYGLYSIHALGSLLFCTSGMVISATLLSAKRAGGISARSSEKYTVLRAAQP